MTYPTIEACRILQLAKVPDARGNLSVIEGDQDVDFSIRRAYWIYDVPGGEERGGHAYRTFKEFVVALSGSFEVEVDDGSTRRTVLLNRSYFGLYIPHMVWRDLLNFSTNAVCLVLTSAAYDERDYLRTYDAFVDARRSRTA